MLYDLNYLTWDGITSFTIDYEISSFGFSLDGFISIFTGALPIFFNCDVWLLNKIELSLYFSFASTCIFFDDGDM